jgi:uncharacterized integral membrane protein
MKARSILLLVLVLFIVIFTLVNWSAFMTPTSLSLLVTHVQAPLGLIMLMLFGLLTAAFLTFVAYMQSTVLLDTRRHTRELQSQRELADKAEASRFTELRGFISQEMLRLTQESAMIRVQLQDQMRVMDEQFRATLEEHNNVLAAHLGELEDRMERGALISMPSGRVTTLP